jgi:hypothetical protein
MAHAIRAAPLVGVLSIDVVAGRWELGYVPWVLQHIAVVKCPTVKC